MPDDEKKPTQAEEIAKLVSEAIAGPLKSQSDKFEKDIGGLRSSYDSNIARLTKAMGDNPGRATEFGKELASVEAERAATAEASKVNAAVQARDDLWKARLEARELGLPPELTDTMTTADQLRSTVLLARHLGAGKSKTDTPKSGAGPGGRTSGADGAKTDPIATLAERLSAAR